MTIYQQLHHAILGHQESLILPLATSDNDVYMAIRQIMRDNPDIFWFSHIWNYNEDARTLRLHYTINKERTKKVKRQIENVILNEFHILDVQRLTQEEQVMYVYKWLALYCNYNIYSAFNQTIYSVFVYRNSVCTGYAKAAQYLFKLLGIESQLVFGKLKNSERLSRHCWLLVKLEGKWYHLDPTLAVPKNKEILVSTGVNPIVGSDGVNYNYFCVDSETVKDSKESQKGSTEYIEDEKDLPVCSSHIDYFGLQHLRIPLNEERKLGHVLTGIGTTADVYTWNQKCATQKVVKAFRKQIPQEVINHEFYVMQELANLPHVLSVDRMTEDGRGIIMEQATPLSDLLSCHYYQLSFSKFCQLILDLIDGVQECLDHGIQYRDIHLNNIYRDGKGIYKLGDFGSCVCQNQRNDVAIGVGSKWYMAPETYKKQEFGEASAIYEIAMVAYFMLNNLLPPLWQKYGKESLTLRVGGKNVPLPVRLQSSVNDAEQKLGKVILQALSYDTSVRFSQSLQCFREEIENIKTTSQDTILFKGDTIELPNELENIEDSVFCNHEFADTLIGKLDKEWATVENALSIDGNGDADASGNNFSLIQTVDFASTCIPNPDILVSNGEVEDLLTSIEREETSDMCNFIPQVEFCGNDFAVTAGGVNCKSNIWKPQETYIPQPQKPKPKRNSSKNSFWSRLFCGRKNEAHEDNVYSSVFAPAEIKRGSHFVVQVYLHLIEETEKVMSLAIESDKNSERRDYIPLLTKLKRNDKVDIELNIYGENILYNERKQLVWQGSFTKCSFDYLVPNSLEVEELSCEVNLFINGNIAGDMRFLTAILDTQPTMLNPQVIARTFNKIFISYAHQDIEQVKHIALAYKAQGADYFFDKDKLSAGDIYEEEIFRYIDNADLFILCWSANAARSEYVWKETEHALMRAYPQLSRQEATLKIYPISIKPRAAYPQNMIDIYNFEEI